MNKIYLLSAVVAFGLSAGVAHSQQAAPPAAAAAKSVDNGTDPTKFTTLAEAKYEYMDLQNGFYNATMRLSYTQPLDDKRVYNVRLRMPVTSTDIGNNKNYGIGDVSVQVGHVFGLTREHAFVAQGELILDTAQRPELGTGKNVLKGSLIYAKFLSNGAIFAPAFVQSFSFSGEKARSDINFTTMDFYYVPKLADSRNLVTFDPAVNVDWENNKSFFSLAVTAGRVVGPSFFGGNGIVFVKPSVFVGGDRPGSWGMEVGYKVLGF